MNHRTYTKIATAGFVAFLWVLSTPLAATPSEDWELKAFTGCTAENRFEHQCLPNVSNVVEKLNALHESLVGMAKDKHSWVPIFRPGDGNPSPSWSWATPYDDQRHVQSIQYIDNSHGDRYIITSLSDDSSIIDMTGHLGDFRGAVQLIKTGEFGSEKGDMDEIAAQFYLHSLGSAVNPGGSQLIGSYLFLALADPERGASPATGVFEIDAEAETIQFKYSVPTTGTVPADDRHQSTAAVTRLADGTFLLAACAGPHDCDGINFYRSQATTLASDPEFRFEYRWDRQVSGVLGEDGMVIPDDSDYWDECHPQSMNFVAEDDGDIYLVIFGAVKRTGVDACATGQGYDDHIFAYKLGRDDEGGIGLAFTNKVDVMPKSHICAGGLLALDPSKELHGLNFMAGSGLWPSPLGNDAIALLATEHYDTCGARWRYPGEGVKGKTRWGVSENWDDPVPMAIDNPTVSVNEGEIAVNSGTYYDSGDVALGPTVGWIDHQTEGSPPNFIGVWGWYWPTADGPDDSQQVGITREGSPFPPGTKTFDLVVNNVPPTAAAGEDQVVECVFGKQILLDATGSTDPGDDELSFSWDFKVFPGAVAPPFNDSSSATPSFQPTNLGSYEPEVTVTDDDGDSDADSVVILYEDTTPPVLSSVSATPNVLWPPNGKMTPVGVAVEVSDACDTMPRCRIFSIESSEPDDDAGDIEITGDLEANLRAERLGSGVGRVYTITVECADAAGNTTAQTTEVAVPHDKGEGQQKP